MSWLAILLAGLGLLAVVGVLRTAFFGGRSGVKRGPKNNWKNEQYLNVHSKGRPKSSRSSGAGGIWSGGD